MAQLGQQIPEKSPFIRSFEAKLGSDDGKKVCLAGNFGRKSPKSTTILPFLTRHNQVLNPF
jgi:hypothetical protein